MEGKQNLKWAISVLEAQTGAGKSMWKAKAMEAKRKRLEDKRAKKAAEGTDKPADEAADRADRVPVDAAAKLQKLRLEKTKRKMHNVRKRSTAIMRKVIGLEKQRLVRKAKQARKRIKELDAMEESSSADLPSDADKQREEALQAIAKNEEDLKYFMPLPIATLSQCVVNRILKRSTMLGEALEPMALTEEAEAINVDPRVQQRVWNNARTVEYMKTAIVAMECMLSGTPTAKEINLERRAQRKKARSEAPDMETVMPPKRSKEDKLTTRTSVLKLRRDGQKPRKAAAIARNKESSPNMSEDDAASEADVEGSTFVANLGSDVSDYSDGGDYSDVSLSDCDIESKRPATKKGKHPLDDYEQGDEDFAKIYGTETKKNRPGQRARRQAYEKMYGDEANHVKVNKKESNKRSSEKQGQRNPAAKSKMPRHDAGDAAPATQDKAKDKPNAGTMHPSWEAKRREKELLAQAKKIKPTKIVFD
ncbi:hypothetical protein H4R19_001125 [Coemansia spiralis]|nr:hypothetical protein H4R19_001125 [Coemansia spiralis]